MSDAYTAEIRMMASNYAPRHWGACTGGLIAISSNAALYSLVGTFYGGDGRTSFGLPDLRGRLPINFGQGPGQSNYNIGARAGIQSVTLTTSQIPAHTHALQGSASSDNSAEPTGHLPAKVSDGTFYSTDTTTTMESFAAGLVEDAGAGHAHPNMMQYLTVTFVICLTGIYPSRN